VEKWRYEMKRIVAWMLLAALVVGGVGVGRREPASAWGARIPIRVAARPMGLCSAPIRPNGGQHPDDIAISPHSGSETQIITLTLSTRLLDSRSWVNGFFILWDGQTSAAINDGGGPPPATLTFRPPDASETGSTLYTAPGYHTVGVYDSVVNVGTSEPHDVLASASFYITPQGQTCTAPAIDGLQLPVRLQGGGRMTVALVTDVWGQVEVALHVPKTAISSPYDFDVISPVDATSGILSLNLLVPVRPAHTVRATVTITATVGGAMTRRTTTVTITP